MKNNIFTMRNLIIASTVLIIVPLVLSGCSKNTSTTTSSSNSQEDYFPGVDRSQIVEPSALSSSGSGGTTNSPDQSTVNTNLKVGSTTRISSNRYGLEGVIRLVTTTSATLENFTYNGTCPGISLYLTRSNNQEQVVVPLSISNTTYDNASFTYSFPSGVTINDIDSVAMTCSDKEDPIFVNRLE